MFPHLTVHENLLVVHERGGGKPDPGAIDIRGDAGDLDGAEAEYDRAVATVKDPLRSISWPFLAIGAEPSYAPC